MLESPFNRFADFKTCNFLKKGLQHRRTPVLDSLFRKVAGLELHKSVKRKILQKNFKDTILVKICEQLLLQFLFLTVNISFWVLVSTLNLIGLLQRSSSRFKKFSLGCLVLGSSFIWKKKEILVGMVTRWHSLSLVVPIVVIHCYPLSFVVSRCATRCHSLYHSLSFVVPLVVTRCTTRLSFYKRSNVDVYLISVVLNINFNSKRDFEDSKTFRK